MATAQPAGLPPGVEVLARAAERVEDFSHPIIASHRSPGGDPSSYRAAVSNEPHCHARYQLLDSSPLLLDELLPDEELYVPLEEELLLGAIEELEELLLDELLGGG